MKGIIPILILIAGAGAAIYYFVFRNNDDRNGRLRFSGNIEMTEVRLAFKRPGRLLERRVDEGEAVSSGTIVGWLDTDELARHRDRAAAAVEMADARLNMLDYEIRQLEEDVAASIDLRKAELEQGRATLRELESGSRDQEIADAEAAVDRARSERDDARRALERARGLRQSGVLSQSDYDSATTREDAAQASYEQAVERLSLVREGPRNERIEGARAAVEKAQAALKSAEATRLELQRKRLEKQTRQAERDAAAADLALVDTQLADSVLTAPTSGVILSKSAEPGEVLAAGTPVVTLGDLDHPWVRAYVGETDLGRIRRGSKARVRSDTFPGKVYEGVVTFIASEAEFTPKQIQTKEERTKLVYRVKIELPNPNYELKLNMPVEGEILAAPRENGD